MKQELVKGYQFCMGSDSYCGAAAAKICFGQSEQVDSSTLRARVLELVAGREFVLIVFNGFDDLRLLQRMSIDLHPLCMIDVQNVAQDHLESKEWTLQRVSEQLNSPYVALHYAGNDAAYTIRAFALLAFLISEEESLHDDGQETIFSVLRQIGEVEVPLSYCLQKRKALGGYQSQSQ